MSAKWRAFRIGLTVLTLVALDWFWKTWNIIVSFRIFQRWDAADGCHHFIVGNTEYRKVSNIRRTKSQNLNASRLIL